jgi:hypothetical protein
MLSSSSLLQWSQLLVREAQHFDPVSKAGDTGIDTSKRPSGNSKKGIRMTVKFWGIV